MLVKVLEKGRNMKQFLKCTSFSALKYIFAKMINQQHRNNNKSQYYEF